MNGELLAFILYFVLMLGIGILVFARSKGSDEEGYFLGGRSMGPWVTAMSAQASDMSGWLLMGLPGSILALGFGQVWVSIGLALGTYLNWLFIAKRLRRFSKAANDSITIPQYLSARFCSANPILRVVCALVFMVFFTVYVASSFKAGGVLFSSVMGIEAKYAMMIFAGIIIVYTFLGGFKAVCWTDFFQGMIMLIAMLLVPIFVVKGFGLDGSAATVTSERVAELVKVSSSDLAAANGSTPANYFNLLPTGKLDWGSVSEILSGLAWGLGYFGMPHIIVRFMAIKKSSMIKKSRIVASIWVVLTLGAACVIGALGRQVIPYLATDAARAAGLNEHVFIVFVRALYPAFISGILLSAILAAAMSTADSQLLVASSSVASDIYKPIFRKNASNKEMLWISRSAVIVIAIVAYIIASAPNSGNIMSLVSNAWGGFGAAFGPAIILSLYWKRFTYSGAVAGIIGGGAADMLWLKYMTASTGIYELLPGFIIGLIIAILVSLISRKPGENVQAIFNNAVDMSIDDDDLGNAAIAAAAAAAAGETAAVEEVAAAEETAEEAVEETAEAAEETVEEAAEAAEESTEVAEETAEEAAEAAEETVEETAEAAEEAAEEAVEAAEETVEEAAEAVEETAEAAEETVEEAAEAAEETVEEAAEAAEETVEEAAEEAAEAVEEAADAAAEAAGDITE